MTILEAEDKKPGGISPLHFQVIKRRLLQNLKGIYPITFWVNFAGDFLVSFWAFFLGKNRRKYSPKIHSKIQIRISELRGQKSTLQGSGLDQVISKALGRRLRQQTTNVNTFEKNGLSSLAHAKKAYVSPRLLYSLGTSKHEHALAWTFGLQIGYISWNRAKLKVTHLRWRTPICGFLWLSAKIFSFLRKSAVSCALRMLEFPGEGMNLRKSAVFCDNLRFGLSLSLSVTSGPSP